MGRPTVDQSLGPVLGLATAMLRRGHNAIDCSVTFVRPVRPAGESAHGNTLLVTLIPVPLAFINHHVFLDLAIIHDFARLNDRSDRSRRHRHWYLAQDSTTIDLLGANTGLGVEAAKHLARFSPRKLILACRNSAKGEKAVRYINETTRVTPGVVETWELDLASFESVNAFAKRGSTNT